MKNLTLAQWILCDSADIESRDPDDNYFLDEYVDDNFDYLVDGNRTGNRALDWTEGMVMMDGVDDTVHNEPNGGQWYEVYAAHSQALNGNLKAYGAWHMFARTAGWNRDTTFVVLVDSIDITGAGAMNETMGDQGTWQMKADVSPDNGTVMVVETANEGSGIRDSLKVTISGQTTGILDFDQPELNISTNPIHKILNIKRMDSSADQFTIGSYNILGQLENHNKVFADNYQVDLSLPDKGYYILHISRTKKGVTPYKFLVW